MLKSIAMKILFVDPLICLKKKQIKLWVSQQSNCFMHAICNVQGPRLFSWMH